MPTEKKGAKLSSCKPLRPETPQPKSLQAYVDLGYRYSIHREVGVRSSSKFGSQGMLKFHALGPFGDRVVPRSV